MARPSAATLWNAGYRAVGRYLAHDPHKALGTWEYAALTLRGLAVFLVWEDSGSDLTMANGVQDAIDALAQANALGWPGTRPIYFAIDEDPHGRQAAIAAYFEGVRSVLGPVRVGAYGGYVALQVAAEHGARWFWQSAGWNPEGVYPGCHVAQLVAQDLGGAIDIDATTASDFGQVPAPSGPIYVPPVPPTNLPEASMLATRTQGGLWIAGYDGGIFAEDGAPYFGSLPGLKVTPSAPIVGIAATPSGQGYWLVGEDGGVFCFGDAPFLGALTDNPAWHAGGAGNPAIGIGAWAGDGTPTGGQGYVIATHTPGAAPALYRLPGDGQFRSALSAVHTGANDDVDGKLHTVTHDTRFSVPA
jgi:hypothetical protein